MSDTDAVKKLEARIAYLEEQMMIRVPNQQTHEFILITLIVWFLERNADMDFTRLSEELMRSVDDHQLEHVPPKKRERIRATMSNSLGEFLAVANNKVQEMKKRTER